jgi:hypothetical protein
MWAADCKNLVFWGAASVLVVQLTNTATKGLLLLIANELNTVACCGKNLLHPCELSVWFLPCKLVKASGVLSCWL